MLYDISPPMHVGMPTWPGDTPYQVESAWALSDNCPVNVARLTLSGHAGAHADAPSHYQAKADCIGRVPLDSYLGPCRVLHCLTATPLLQINHLQQALQSFDLPLPPRVLIRTWPQCQPAQWSEHFCAIAPSTINWLAQQGVRLIGVDTPSLDAANSKTLDAHHAVARQRMAILENLLLDAVPEGDYELIALPLKLMDMDASPVRAVLRPLPANL